MFRQDSEDVVIAKVGCIVVVAIGLALCAIEWRIVSAGGTTNILGGLGLIMVVAGLMGFLASRNR